MSEVKEKPILFSTPMVRALLEGRKTQTRRIFKVPSWSDPDYMPPELYPNLKGLHMVADESRRLAPVKCPYGKPGYGLWVRETWRADEYCDCDPPCTIYRADIPSDILLDTKGIAKWKPAIHMRRWRSRITLEITDVRVQRLQEIDAYDCLAEGIPEQGGNSSDGEWRLQQAYRKLWESINGAGSWEANLWCWALTFKVVTA